MKPILYILVCPNFPTGRVSNCNIQKKGPMLSVYLGTYGCRYGTWLNYYILEYWGPSRRCSRPFRPLSQLMVSLAYSLLFAAHQPRVRLCQHTGGGSSRFLGVSHRGASVSSILWVPASQEETAAPWLEPVVSISPRPACCVRARPLRKGQRHVPLLASGLRVGAPRFRCATSLVLGLV